MILYFADRNLNVLGMASTKQNAMLAIQSDTKTEDLETGVGSLDIEIGYSEEQREFAEMCASAGNFVLQAVDDDSVAQDTKSVYQIVTCEGDRKESKLTIYCEDGGLDLLNDVLVEYPSNTDTEASHAGMDADDLVQLYIADTGFEIGINEVDGTSKDVGDYSFDEQTITERMLKIGELFGYEIDYSFAVENLRIAHKYVNIHKRIGGADGEITLRYGHEIDNITIKTSIENLCTGYLVYGADDTSGDPVTMGEYDDGDFYVSESKHYLLSRNALEKYGRKSSSTSETAGHIIKIFNYDTTDLTKLREEALASLKKACEPEINYDVETVGLLPEINLGDTINITDDANNLYFSARVQKIERSEIDDKATFTLGDYLMKSSGISDSVQALADEFRTVTEKVSAVNEKSAVVIRITSIDYTTEPHTATLIADLYVDGVLTAASAYAWTKADSDEVIGTDQSIEVTDLSETYICTVTW